MNYLALRMLTGDRAKFLGIVFGVTLAALLMVHQLTIFLGILSRTGSIVRDITAGDLLVMDPHTELLDDIRPIPDTALARTRGVQGVEWAVPLYKGPIRARLPDGHFRACTVIGLDDATLLGGPANMLEGSLSDLRTPDAVIIDTLDAANLLADGQSRPLQVGDTFELNDRRAIVVGLCKNTRPFISQPVIYTTYSRAVASAPPERSRLSLVLVKAAPGHAPVELAQRIHQQTTLAAYPKDTFRWMTISFYLRHTGIPVNFGTTILLACIVGAAITGQTFYLFTLENQRHLAAFKAMGAPNSSLLRMTLLQAAFVGFIGYGLGTGAAALNFAITRGTEIDFELYWQVLALTATVIAAVIALAAAVSIRRVLRLEPAIVFK